MDTLELLKQARDSLQKFVETDETNLDQPGNEDYAEIYHEGVRVLEELNKTLAQQPPNGRPMLTPEQREIAIKKLCELCGSAGGVEWIAEFAGQQIDGVLLLPAYKAIQYAKEQPK